MLKRISVLLLTFSAFILNAKPINPLFGQDAMVASSHHLANKVGENILAHGGNAVDAAVAIGYALAVVDPCCGNLGGGGFMLIRLANGQTTFINFRETAPAAATVDKFNQGQAKKNSYLNIGVPGTVKGLNFALKKYGSLSRKTIIGPAIKLAKKGYPLTIKDAQILQYAAKKLSTQPNVTAIYFKDDKPLAAGSHLKQPELAKSLQKIAHQGIDAFYTGKIAQKIADANKKHNGLITKVDLANYSIAEQQPITCNYRGYHIITAPPPSAGGMIICQMLNVLEGYDMQDLGFHSAASTHITIEAMRQAFTDRNLLGDPAFVNNPMTKLISKPYAKKIRTQIKPQKANNNHIQLQKNERHETTGYVVVDKQGNAVAVTYTLNGLFGAKVIANDTGFFLNNEMDDFNLQPGKPNLFGLVQGKANIVAPGKRPLSSMAPTIITKNDQVFLLLSTSGGSTIPTQLVAVIQNIIDFNMSLQEAINAPRLHMQALPNITFYEPFSFSHDTLKILQAYGHRFQLGSYYGIKKWGAVMGIMVDPKTKQLRQGIDQRRASGV